MGVGTGGATVRGGSGRASGGAGATKTPAPVVKPKRGHTSKEILTLDWDFAVVGQASDDPSRVKGHSYAAAKRQALPRAAAFRAAAGDDPRPLLVLRECGWCEGSDDALLSSRFDNEKTILLSRWFHAVKLPNHVLKADHEFRNLFEGKSPPHLFLATRDGSHVVGLDGQQSQSELWSAMDEIIDDVYGVDAMRGVKKVYKLLDQFDLLDQAEDHLRERMDNEIEKKGPGSSRLRKLKRDLDQTLAKRAKVRAALDRLLNEPLRELGV